MNSLNTTIEAHKREQNVALRRTLVPRQFSASLSKALSSPLVKIITGPHQARKFEYVFFDEIINFPQWESFINETGTKIQVIPCRKWLLC